jgi:chromosome segregation protein
LLQREIADLREAEAKIEHLRADQTAKSDALSAIQGRFYAAGADVTRVEQGIQYARELRQRQRADLEQADAQIGELRGVRERDQVQLEALAQELATMIPGLDSAHAREKGAATVLEHAEQALAAWQSDWDAHAQAVAHDQRETQVERARIEQLESQQRRLLQQQERLQSERSNLAELAPMISLETLAERASAAREAGQNAAQTLQQLLGELNATREREREQTQSLNALRARYQQAQGSLVSTEALQQAALGKASGKVSEWLKSKSLDHHPRVAQQLRVERGWERAVETVLGSYLEAVCVDGLDSVTDYLSSFDGGHLVVVSTHGVPAPEAGASLFAKVQGSTVLAGMLSAVHTADNLNEALKLRRQLKSGESVVTRDGIWLGADWLRVARDADPHTGIIEREESLRDIRAQVTSLADQVSELERSVEATRDLARDHEDKRDRTQAEVNRLHRDQVDRKAEHDSAHARTQDAARRLAQLESQLAEVMTDLSRSETELRSARARMETAIDQLAALEPKRIELEEHRERLRNDLATARAAANVAQQQARELAVQVESRRSSHTGLTTTVSRIEVQIGALETRHGELSQQIEAGEAPLAAAQNELEEALKQRAAIEEELKAAKIASDELDTHLHELEAARLEAEQRVDGARAALDEARLAAQQVRIRRESVAEQFAQTSFELAALMAQLAPDANTEAWEAQLTETRGKIERLGQVNLAAIGEFKEQSERKEYLDRQCKDLTDALEVLESAMRKIDRETRSRFQETFDRVNAGLKEKFPRLFGGGHAYLELSGEESQVAGVSVMARPPGKRNSTISQLSGGEKALTAVALVFSIFDLNPAPFCLLDEVDAPLDENNVGRFCDIVREMSRNVQFIFITHNKTTMELASQLVGVTMNEPGVSRLVAVDVDEAVRMAAM